jgi:XisH protein
MPQRDIFHETVIIALQRDGWKITNDPLFVPTEGGVNFFIDLGIEQIIGAEKEGVNIAVEIKSFDESSPIYGFYEILGQFLMYELALQEQLKPWDLFIAISKLGLKKLEDAPIFSRAIQKFGLKFVVFDPLTQTIEAWKR